MKAVTRTRYSLLNVLKIKEAEKPTRTIPFAKSLYKFSNKFYEIIENIQLKYLSVINNC